MALGACPVDGSPGGQPRCWGEALKVGQERESRAEGSEEGGGGSPPHTGAWPQGRSPPYHHTLPAALTLSPVHRPPTPLCSPQPPHPGLLALPAAPIMPPSQASTSTLEHHVWSPSPPLGAGSQSPSRPPFIGEQPLPCAAHWLPVPFPEVSPMWTGLWSPFALPARGLAGMGAQGTLADD